MGLEQFKPYPLLIPVAECSDARSKYSTFHSPLFQVRFCHGSFSEDSHDNQCGASSDQQDRLNTEHLH